MHLRRFYLLILLCTAGLYLLSNTGCANIVPPSGGAKDTLPPNIVSVHPGSGSLHFKDKKIVFKFNEYVDLNDVRKNLLFSPLPKTFPDVDRKLKTVTIKLKDTLDENTTYSINFKDAVKDLNEGNKMKDIMYVYSTGSFIDSLQLSGNIKLAKTGKPDSTLTVMLYKNLTDSAVVKERPYYIARLDSTGDFLFRNLASGKYKLYALKDESGMYRYTNKEALFAFADSVIVIDSIQHPPVKMYAYEAEEKVAKYEVPESNKKEKRIKFTSNLEADKQSLLEAFELNFEAPLKSWDSTKISFSKDSSFTPIKDYSIKLDSNKLKLTLSYKWDTATLYNLVLPKDFATDISNRQLLKADTIRFQTKKLEEYGQAILTFKGLENIKNPVFQMISSGKVKNAFPLNSKKLDIQLYTPGEYEFQILQDDNKNGVWDPGDFFGKRTQPERIALFTRKITIKPNWPTEIEIIVDPLN